MSNAPSRLVTLLCVVGAVLVASGVAAQSPPGLTGAGGRQHSRASPAFRTGVELVALDVCVRERDGRFVAALVEEDFLILDDGRPQETSLFLPAGRVPLAVVLLLDRSSSMVGPKLQSAKAAAAAFVRTLRPEDSVGLTTFNQRVQRLSPLDSAHPAVEQALANVSASGRTALFEALLVALQELDRARRDMPTESRSVILLLTDGVDTASLPAFDDVLEVARRSGVIIYAISLQTADERHVVAPPYQLVQLAHDTGGVAVGITDPERLTSVYREIGVELRHLYRIGYVPTRAVGDGKWHTLSVRVSRRDARVRARAGYYASKAPSTFPNGPRR